MANPVIQSYKSYYDKDEEERRKYNQTSYSNPIITAYKNAYPTTKQTPSQEAPKIEEPVKREVEQPKKKKRFSIKETLKTFGAGVTAAIGMAKGGTATFLENPAKELSLDTNIDRYKYLIDFEQKKLDSGKKWSYINGKMQEIDLTPEEIEASKKSIQENTERLNKISKKEEEQVTFQERLYESAGKSFEKSIEKREAIAEEYGFTPAWTVQWAANELAFNTPQIIGSTLLSTAAMVATKNPALARAFGMSYAYVQEAGGAYQTAKEQGLSDAQAQDVANTVGTGNSILEMAAIENIISFRSAKAVKASILQKIGKWATKRVLDGTFEAGTETMQEILANAVEKTYNEDKDLFEGIPETIFISFLLGAGGGLVADTTQMNRVSATPAIDPKAVGDINKAVEDAVSTPKESRTPEQEELVQSLAVEEGIASSGVASKETVKDLEVFRGSNGKVEKQTINFQDVLKVNGYQEQLLEVLSNQGVKEAGDILNNRTNFFKKADPLIRETFAGQYDAIQYTNKDTGIQGREKVGDEFFDIENNTFYAVKEETAEAYSMQRGREQKFQDISEEEYKRKEELIGEKVSKKKTADKLERRLRAISEYQKRKNSYKLRTEAAKNRADKLFSTTRQEVVGEDPKSLVDYVGNRVFDSIHSAALEDVTKDKKMAGILKDIDGLLADLASDVPAPRIRAKSLSIAERYQRLRAERGLKAYDTYISDQPDNIKYRQLSDQDIILIDETKKTPEITSAFLEHPDIKGKKELNYIFIKNLLASKSLPLKQVERTLIGDVLLLDDFRGNKKINMDDFVREVKNRLPYLEMIETGSYSSYGVDEVGLYGGEGTTYLLNSPTFNHGNTGHFSGDYVYYSVFQEENYEIKQIPTTDQWAIIKKDVELTEENVAQNVLGVFKSEQEAKDWIESRKEDDGMIRAKRNEGLFAHGRTYDFNDTKETFVLEEQSDPFQKGITDSERRIKWLKKKIREISEYSGRDEEIKEYQIELEELQSQLKDSESSWSDDEKIFRSFKNTWNERLTRELISRKAREGYETLYIPTPRTVAFIEGFITEENARPYEIIGYGDNDQLVAGDLIDYIGQEMIVVDSDNYSITVAEKEYVNEFSFSDFLTEESSYRWGEISSDVEDAVEASGLGGIETVGDVKRILEVDTLVNRVSKAARADTMIQDLKEQSSKDIKVLEERLAEEQARLDRTLKDVETLNNDDLYFDALKIIGSGETTYYGIDVDVVDKVAEKYGLNEAGKKALTRSIQESWADETGYVGDRKLDISVKDLKESTLKRIKESYLSWHERDVESRKGVIESEKSKTDRKIKEFEEYKTNKPSAKELKGISQEIINAANSATWDYNLLNYESGMFLKEIGVGSDSDSIDIDLLGDDWRQNYEESSDGDDLLRSIYEDYWLDGDNVYALEQGKSFESLSQPSEYDSGAASIEDFWIEDLNNEEHQTVLRYYEKQVIPYWEKIKGDLELTERDGFEWYKVSLSENDKATPAAFRVKEDLEKVNIPITSKQEEEIMKLNREKFADDNIKVVTQVLYNNKALGAYLKDIIYILKGQANPKDTYYHEAAHKYIDSFLSLQEQTELFLAAMDKYNTEDVAVVEEMLAEDFIAYAKSREGITGSIKYFFDKIINRINIYLDNKDAIDKLYEEIISPAEVKSKKIEKLVKEEKAVKKKVTKTAQKKAAKKVSALPKTVQVPETLLPVGTGEKRVSTLETRMKGLLDKVDEEDAGKLGLQEFKKMNNKEQIAAATEYILENPDNALKIVRGTLEPPKGLLRNSVYVAMVQNSFDKPDLATKLASLSSSRYGQEIEILKELDTDSPVKWINDVIGVRAKAFERKSGKTANKAVKEEVAKVKKEIKSPSKSDWASFISEIEC